MECCPIDPAPAFAVVMKVGPHSGMSLAEIAASKAEEERRLGRHFWGYSGSLCHPRRVVDFVAYARAMTETPVQLLLIETSSDYRSSIGKIAAFSTDQQHYTRFADAVQLEGAQFAFVARDLQRIDSDIDLDAFSVVGGRNDGRSLSQHLRHRINKAFVRTVTHAAAAARISARCRLAYSARLVEPFAVWLRPDAEDTSRAGTNHSR